MTKHCETFDHTADVGLAARADSLGELLEALAEGLADVICPRRQAAARETVEIDVASEDVEALAVDFLWEVMDAIQACRKAVAAVCVSDVSETHVRATLGCEPLDADKHQIEAEVKAVTYHELEITCRDGQWHGRVILDL